MMHDCGFVKIIIAFAGALDNTKNNACHLKKSKV